MTVDLPLSLEVKKQERKSTAVLVEASQIDKYEPCAQEEHLSNLILSGLFGFELAVDSFCGLIYRW